MCGQVRYEIRGEMGPITHCHCPSCRKAHASAFSSVAVVQLEDLTVIAGEALLKFYESSPGKRRYFCSNCGSQIYAKREDQDHYVFRMGTIDGDPGARPVQHIFTRYKAAWYKLHDDLPEYLEWPPQVQPDAPAAHVKYKHLYALMNEVFKEAARKEASTSLLLLMIDISTEEAEQQGLARELHHRIELNVRESDMIDLLGDSQFAVILPYTDARASMILAERIRNAFKGMIQIHGGACSIGAATVMCDRLHMDKLMLSIDELVAMAEKACHFSNRIGGDKAVHHDSLPS